MKSKLYLLLLLCIGPMTIIAQLKIDKQYYIDQLNAGNYSGVIQEMIALQKQPYGKCCLTDYFIAKALCLGGHSDRAQDRFKKMQGRYKLPPATINLLKTEESNCSAATEVVDEPYEYINNYTLPNSSVVGKLGAVYNCFQSYTPVKVIKPVTEDEFSSRLFSVADSAKALAKIRSIIPEGYTAESRGNFILVTLRAKYNLKSKKAIIDELKKTLKFYVDYYKLRQPDKIFTAYIVPDSNSLRRIAEAVHGIQIPKENYGYSLLSDLSLLGISNSIGTGTLKHELFHLVVRADIGDMPAWLDEGIATLYEESHWVGKQLKSNKEFWRTATLRKALAGFHLLSKLPDLESLLNYSWNEFEGTDQGDICRASVNYALAKHFTRWLEVTGKLDDVLIAYKSKLQPDSLEKEKSNSEILVEVLNAPISVIELNFDTWLKQNYSLSILNPEFHDPQKNAVISIKAGIRELKTLYDSLDKAGNLRARNLKIEIKELELSLQDEIGRFEKGMKDHIGKYGQEVPHEIVMQTTIELENRTQIIRQQLRKTIEKYKTP